MPNRYTRIIASLHRLAINSNNPIVYQTLITKWNQHTIPAAQFTRLEDPAIIAKIDKIKCNNSIDDCWKEIEKILEKGN